MKCKGNKGVAAHLPQEFAFSKRQSDFSLKRSVLIKQRTQITCSLSAPAGAPQADACALLDMQR
jgi:hypothetical protein